MFPSCGPVRRDVTVRPSSRPVRIIEEEKLTTRILLAWKKDRRPSAVMQEFINICEEYKEISL